MALVVFVLIVIISTGVVRLNDLRLRSQRGEQQALLRLRFLDLLSSGADSGVVLDAAAHELVGLFDLAWCEFSADDSRHPTLGEHSESGTREFVNDA